jgi:hypothetical protein
MEPLVLTICSSLWHIESNKNVCSVTQLWLQKVAFCKDVTLIHCNPSPRLKHLQALVSHTTASEVTNEPINYRTLRTPCHLHLLAHLCLWPAPGWNTSPLKIVHEDYGKNVLFCVHLEKWEKRKETTESSTGLKRLLACILAQAFPSSSQGGSLCGGFRFTGVLFKVMNECRKSFP